MKRWLLRIAAGISTLLFLGVLALWVRSYFVYEHFSVGRWYFIHEPSEVGYLIRSHNGWLYFERRSRFGAINPYWHRDWGEHDVVFSPNLPIKPDYSMQLLGVGYYAGSDYNFPHYLPRKNPRPGWDGAQVDNNYNIIAIPHLLVLVPCALLPLLWLRSHRKCRRQMRLSRGLCPNCGYDLRATPNRCPECGAVLEAARGAAP